MAIQRKPNASKQDAQDAFIQGAPDAQLEPDAAEYDKGVRIGNKRQISLTITPELLQRVDEVAKRTGQARAAVINLAIYKALEGDIFKSGR